MPIRLDNGFGVPQEIASEGYAYFLEVPIIRDEILAGLEGKLTDQERLDAVLYYAEHDAFPDWLCAKRG